MDQRPIRLRLTLSRQQQVAAALRISASCPLQVAVAGQHMVPLIWIAKMPRYGPNHDAVAHFRDELSEYPWFTSVGQALESEVVELVDFTFIARNHDHPYGGWGPLLAQAEQPFERLIFDHRRLDAHNAVLADFAIHHFWSDQADTLYLSLDEEFGDAETGYFEEMYMYPHELFDPPDRLVRGAAGELLVDDLEHFFFFRSLMPWFKAGRCPVGWSGEYPNGRILLW